MDIIVVGSLALIALCLLGISWFAGSDAPFVTTKYKKVKEILKIAGVKKDKIFYELGSGDGRVVFAAAQLGAKAYGIEQSYLRVWMSRLEAKKQELPNAQFYHGNIFDREYYPADVVFIYLLTPAVLRLEEKLKKELKKGSVVITQTYHFKNWKPFKTVEAFNFYKV